MIATINLLEYSGRDESTAMRAKFRFTVWSLFVATTLVASLFALPVEALENLLAAALVVVELGLLLIPSVLLIGSRRSKPMGHGERLFNQLLLDMFATAAFVTVVGFAAIACKQLIPG